MTLSAAVRITALLFGWTFAGCPGGSPDPTDGGPADAGLALDDAGQPPLSVDALCEGLEERVCAGMASCGCTLEGQPYSLGTCAVERTARCAGLIDDALGAALASGAVVIEGDNAAACFVAAEGNAAACLPNADATLPPPCALLFVDPAALGEACMGGIAGGACAHGAGLCPPARGACAPRKHAGDVCAPNENCGPALLCVDGACAPSPPPLAQGQGPCVDTAQCAQGLACAGSVCGAGPARDTACGGAVCAAGDVCTRAYATRVCAPQGAAGSTCSNDSGCIAPLLCLDGGQCGDAPGLDAPCAPHGGCADGLLCDRGNTQLCVNAPAVGEPCLVGDATCAAGMGCDVDNLCALPPAEGEACLLPQLLCGAGLGCAFEADGSICRTQSDNGGDCTSDRSCASGFCDFGTLKCHAFLGVGEGCANSNGCPPAMECSDLAGGFTCQPVPTVDGAACYERCAEDLVCSGLGGRCSAGICASPIP